MERNLSYAMAQKLAPIESEINKILDVVDDIQKIDEQKKRSHAFTTLCLMILCNIRDYKEAYMYITDGGGDGGMDAIYFDEENYTLTILNTKYHTKGGKNGISTSEIEKTSSTIDNVLHTSGYDIPNSVLNDNCKRVLLNIVERLKSHKKDKDLITNIYYCFNDEDDSKEDILAKYNTKTRKDIHLKICDITDIKEKYNAFILPKIPEYTGKIKVDAGNSETLDKSISEHSFGSVTAYHFFMSYESFIRFLENYYVQTKGQDNDISVLFYDNIREYLGTKENSVNQDILNTLTNQSDIGLFGIYNNGITISCDYARPLYKKHKNVTNNDDDFEIKNPQIINGLQTTMTLWKAYKDGKIPVNANFKIFIRLYKISEEGRDENVIYKITKATNNQTPIVIFDQLSNEQFNTNIQVYFNNKGYNYIKKRTENISKNAIYFGDALKFWQALYDPIESKRAKSFVYNRIHDAIRQKKETGIEYIDDKFVNDNDDKFEKDVFNASFIYNEIIRNEKIKQGGLLSQYSFMPHSDEMCVYVINKLLKNKDNDYDITNEIDSAKSLYTDALNIIDNAIKTLNYKSSFHNLFKTMGKKHNGGILNAVNNSLEKHLNPPQ